MNDLTGSGPASEVVSPLRQLAKATARGLARLCILPLYFLYLCRVPLLGEKAFRSSSQLLSLVPGLYGDYLRREFYRLTLPEFGKMSCVEFGTLFSSPRARIADCVYIGSYCMVADVEIGRDVLVGSHVHLGLGKAQHGIADLDRPIRLQPGRLTMVRVGEDTWIGNAAIVMANVGKKCVIGAGSVVVSDIPDYSLAAGNPARVLRHRQQSTAPSGQS